MAECSLDNCNEECFEDNDKCILHCEKDTFTESNNRDFIRNLEKCRIGEGKHIYKFKDVNFPRKLQLKYTDLNTNLPNDPTMSFDKCTFYNPLTFQIGNFKSTFDECTFYEEWNHYSNNATYNNCSFNNYKYRNEKDEIAKIINLQFYNCYFEELNFHNISFSEEFLIYDSTTKYKKINTLVLTKCVFEKKFILNLNDNISEKYREPLIFDIDKIDLSNSTFRNKVKIQSCKVEEGKFYNTRFVNLADFYKTKFNAVDFERTDFKDISVFSEVQFNCNVNFKYAKFLKHTIFRDTVISGYFNLRDSIFDADANFLDITSEERSKNKHNEYIGNPKDIKVGNRETARIIKNFYDNSNNIIEGNRFYKLEMKAREKEIKIYKEPFNWLVFKFHRLSSNHSQNWLLPLFWICVFSFFCVDVPNDHNIFQGILHRINLGSIVFDKMADLINPFSIMIGVKKLTFSLLLFKIIIAYLIYQFVVSVRQNTRRK